MPERLRLVYGNVGDVTDPNASSGSTYPLYEAMKEYYEMVGGLDASLSTWRKYLNAALNFHPDPIRWRERRHKTLTTFRAHTATAKKRICAYAGRFDFYLQERALFSPVGICNKPYGIVTDATHANTLESWPDWSPFSESECSRWLEEERRIYDNAAVLFPRSEYVAKSMVTDYGQPEEKVFVVGAGLNFAEIPPQSHAQDSARLLFIGYDFPRKGGEELLDAFTLLRKHMPKAKLDIVGPSHLGRPVPDGVTLIGKVSNRQEISRLYCQSALFVMPSLFEPWGNVYLEAMAHGVPTVGCRWGATPEVIRDGIDGVLVPRRDSEALGKTLIDLLSDPELLAALGASGRERVLRDYTWEAVAARMHPHIEAAVR
jgi:glycosyltransferase involved in cell wall biosynthesis